MPRTTEVADNVIAVVETASTNTLARQMLRDAPWRLRPTGVPVWPWWPLMCRARAAAAGTHMGECSRRIDDLLVHRHAAGGRDRRRQRKRLATVIAGFAALDALRGRARRMWGCQWKDCGLRLKWPNDLFCQGRKLGGILTEMVPLPGRDDSAALVIGIGINLAIPADRLPTEQSTSLQLHVQGLPDARTLRDMIAAHIVRSLSSRLSGFVADPHAAAERLREETSCVCWTLGRRVEARFTDGSV